MSKKNVRSTEKKQTKPQLKLVTRKEDMALYRITSNDMRILYVHRPGTHVVTSDIVYFVGARDEVVGETGLAHMFEHMLFKPTHFDIARKIDSSIMQFEREVGVTINANTWKDRTTYYISYPKEHFDRALRIEAERMHGLVLTEKEFEPERKNVLSEFDMYAGDEHFALSVQMAGVAFQSHPYGHETIGYREDIESYSIAQLQSFYNRFYAPNNATLIIVGDVTEKEMRETVLKHFGNLEKSQTLQKRVSIHEPKQEGERRVIIERPSETQVYALGILHEPFPSKAWFETMIIFDMLGGGDDSILHKRLVDKGLVTQIQTSLEPTFDDNLGIIFLTLTKKITHDAVHTLLKEIVSGLTPTVITPYLKKAIAKSLTHEVVSRENSLSYTAELVEYVSAGAWEAFFDSETILRSITAKDIHARIQSSFEESKTTVGYFKGKQ